MESNADFELAEVDINNSDEVYHGQVIKDTSTKHGCGIHICKHTMEKFIGTFE